MQEVKTTNLLLFLILLALVANVLVKLPHNAIAETFKLDDCITSRPDQKPAGFVHVIQH